MNRGPVIFVGILFCLAVAWCLFIFAPQVQLGRLEAALVQPVNALYPTRRPGFAELGQEVYRANGCYYCHTQQVRPEGYAQDIARLWGARQTVARDFLYDHPVMLGSLRMGPDLANIGMRQPDITWQLMHLYNPKLIYTNSIMPAYPYLFEKQKIGRRPSPDALPLPEGAVEKGFEIVPTKEAMALVYYLLSLSANVSLPEMPLPLEEGETNQVTETNLTSELPDTNQPPAQPESPTQQ